MRSRSADRPEVRRGPGACGDAAPSLADDDGGEGGHRGVSVGHRGGRRPAWPSRRQPWWRQWRSPTPHRRQGRSAGRPDSPQRHRVRRGGRQDRPPPPAPPAGAGSHQRPTEPPAGLDRDACCRSSCHSQGGHAADFPDCPQGRRVESRKRLQRFQPPAGDVFPSAAGVMNTMVRTGSLPFEPQGVWTMPRSSRPSRLATAIACTAVAAAAFTVNRWLAAREAAAHEPSLAATPSPAVHYERISRDAPRPGREVPRPPDASP